MTNSVDPDQTASYRSSLIWVHSVCLLILVSNVRQLFAADAFCRRHLSDAFFLGALRVKKHSGSVRRVLN